MHASIAIALWIVNGYLLALALLFWLVRGGKMDLAELRIGGAMHPDQIGFGKAALLEKRDKARTISVFPVIFGKTVNGLRIIGKDRHPRLGI